MVRKGFRRYLLYRVGIEWSTNRLFRQSFEKARQYHQFPLHGQISVIHLAM